MGTPHQDWEEAVNIIFKNNHQPIAPFCPMWNKNFLVSDVDNLENVWWSEAVFLQYLVASLNLTAPAFVGVWQQTTSGYLVMESNN